MPQIPHILSFLTFWPALGALILLFLRRPQDLPDDHGGHDDHDDPHGEPPSPTVPAPKDPARATINGVALLFALVNFAASILLLMNYRSDFISPSTRNMQFLEQIKWITIGSVNVNYKMGVDGISILLILLTTFLMLLCVLYSQNVKVRLKEFMVFLLLLETGMIGVFCALDLVLFYFFWEAMLIPMYFLIGIFGHENRIYAAIKFFLFTFIGSVLMLVAIVSVYLVTGSLDVIALSNPSTGPGLLLALHNPQALMWMFAAFSLAFMIKVPMFPFHTWLPDAHVEAPTAGSVILAGVMLKMGTYGFIRFCIPLFPAQAHQSATVFIVLAIVGIIYGSIVAAVQPDAKKLVAYSSVAHLGFVILGIFTFTPVGMMGALVQNINHGISTPMLFFLVGMLYERRHTRTISEFGGLKKVMPMMATLLLIATFASIAVPFFNGFVGEFPILLGAWSSSAIDEGTGPAMAAFAATGMILSAVYMLWWFQRLMLGPITKSANRRLPDLTRTEWLVLTPLAVMVFWIGLFSSFWTDKMTVPVSTLLPVAGQRLDTSQPNSVPLNKQYADDERDVFGGPPKGARARSIAPGASPGTGSAGSPRPSPGGRVPRSRPPMSGPMEAPGPARQPGGSANPPGAPPGATGGDRPAPASPANPAVGQPSGAPQPQRPGRVRKSTLQVLGVSHAARQRTEKSAQL